MQRFKIFLIAATVLAASGFSLFLAPPARAVLPTLSEAFFIDHDHNGTIDRIKVRFSAPVTGCKFEAGDWVIFGGSVGLTYPTWRLNGAGYDGDCDGSTDYFYLLVSGNPNTTGYPSIFIAAEIEYRNQGLPGSVWTSSGAAEDSPVILVEDNASPVIISATPVAGATGVSVTTSYVRATFSEPMVTAATSMSISVGSWGPPSWSDGNKTLTRSRLLALPYDTMVSVTITGEDVRGNLLSSGVLPAVINPWNFRTTVDATAVSATQSTVSALPTSAVADGAHISTVTVTVKNAAGSPLSGKTVTLSSSRGSLDTIATMVGTTGSDGKAYFQVSSSSAGTAIFTAAAAGVVIDQTATVTFTAPASTVSATQSTISASPTSVLANGTDFSVVTVTVRDAAGNPLSGKLVSLYSSRGATDTIVIGASGGLTDSSGKAYFDVKSSTAGTSSITAVADSVTISGTATIVFTSSGTGGLVYGDLFKESGSTAVYYYGTDGKRHVFPTQAIYFSWYSGFSAIKIVSHSTVISVPLGGNVIAKPGTYLIQFVSMDTPFLVLDPKVYALTETGQLRWLTSASAAISLYGADWERKIVPVPEVFRTNYIEGGANINSASDYNKVSVEAAARTISDTIR